MDKPTENIERPSWERRKWPWVVLAIAALVVLLLLFNHYYQWYPWPWRESQDEAAHKIQERAIKPKPSRVIDYGKIKDEADTDLGELIQERKSDFGLDKSVDMVVKSGETIRIGKEVIPLNQILSEIEAQKKGKKPSMEAFLRRPEIAEEDIRLKSSSTVSSFGEKLKLPSRSESSKPWDSQKLQTGLPTRETAPGKRLESYYGIYVVRPGDNLWNIHFAFLQEYLGSRKIVILPDADEPIGSRSSGVGRILKYAESMVYIFNIKTKQLSDDLNLLEPREKVVIFNLTLLDKILGSLTPEQLKVIRFDGLDLILPEQESTP